MPISHFDQIDAYQRSKRLYPQIVKLTQTFPSHGWHLKDQLCRSANSIHANIAEGFSRSPAEFKMYLTRALGSCNETKSHIEDAINIELLDQVAGRNLIDEYTVVGKQIYRLREKWNVFPKPTSDI